jgi:hypothetical protein
LMLHDPPVPVDGSCARCGGQRRIPPANAAKLYATAELYAREPFCSTECCREWHGCVISKDSIWSITHYRKAAA